MPPVASIVASSMICMSITVLSGMMPIFATVTDRPWTVLQREQGFSSTKVVRLRAALVVLQIALCCALVIFATLLMEGFHKALKTGIGQKLGNPILVTVQALPPPMGAPADYFKAVEQSAKSVPRCCTACVDNSTPGRPTDLAIVPDPAGVITSARGCSGCRRISPRRTEAARTPANCGEAIRRAGSFVRSCRCRWYSGECSVRQCDSGREDLRSQWITDPDHRRRPENFRRYSQSSSDDLLRSAGPTSACLFEGRPVQGSSRLVIGRH